MNARAATRPSPLVVPSAFALTGPAVPTYAAAAVCQGQPATIEGATRDHHRDRGQRRHRLDRTPTPTVDALGGNDLDLRGRR